MSQSSQSVPIIICSVLGVITFIYFLLSPVLMLPAEPEFARLTVGKESVLIEGDSWVAIYGLHLVLQLTVSVNLFVLVLFILTSALIVILSPFIGFMSLRPLLNTLSAAVLLNLVGIGFIITAFTSYLAAMSAGVGFVSMILLLIAVFLRKRMLMTIQGAHL